MTMGRMNFNSNSNPKTISHIIHNRVMFINLHNQYSKKTAKLKCKRKMNKTKLK